MEMEMENPYQEGYERWMDYHKNLCTNLDNPYCWEDQRHSEFESGMESAEFETRTA